MPAQLLMRVAESHVLTGLGVLLVAAMPAPLFAELVLHSTLSIELRYADGRQDRAVASVEELTHGEKPATWALLLPLAVAAVPDGTEVWWCGEETDW